LLKALQNRLFAQYLRYRDFKILTPTAVGAKVLESLWSWSWTKNLVFQSLPVI